MVDSRTASVARDLFRAVGSVVANECLEKLEALISNDDMAIFAMKIDPLDYADAYTFQRDYACVEFLRKLNLGTKHEKVLTQRCIAGFYDIERQNAKTNFRLADWNAGFFPDVDHRLLPVFDRSKRFIARVLGEVPEDIDFKFGPGATFGLKAAESVLPNKICNSLEFTDDVKPLLVLLDESCMRHVNRRWNYVEKSVPGNRFTTVDKDATKRRGICIEPGCNLSFQLGVGAYLKKRLRAVGIKLSRIGDEVYAGQSIHQALARGASMTGSHATIDLSNASDTVCLELVRWLLPKPWFELLDTLRSKRTLMPDGKWVYLEKFSSMGNGFTFELETLIFLALIYGVAGDSYTCGVDFFAYGDDIIVPSDIADDVLGILRFCGFTPNPKKTFTTGPFRESCGGDYFNGIDVRPHYLKELPNEPEKLISLANGLRRLGSKDPCGVYRYSYPFRAWLRVLDALPSSIRRCRGPVALGDLVIHDDPEHWSFKIRGSVRYFRVYRPVSHGIPVIRWDDLTRLAYSLYSPPGDSVISARSVTNPCYLDKRSVVRRGSVSGYKLGFTPYS